jgi:hypothetical protein
MSQFASTVAAQILAAFGSVSVQRQHEQSQPVEVCLEQLVRVGGGASSVDSPRNGW